MNKEQTAFERLFEKIREIATIMESSSDKKNAVKNIKSAFPEFQDMSDNTIEQEIKSFQFLLPLVTELDVVKKELNNTLNNLEATKQELNNTKGELSGIKQQLNKKEGEMTGLNNQLNNNMDSVEIESFMKETEQRFAELNNRIKQLETARQEIKQVKQSIKQRGLNNIGKWNVVENGGYYRAFRNIDGKNIGVYIGKKFDEQETREKIAGKGYPID